MKLIDAINQKNQSTPPIWMMRQAGRYHTHYQALKRQHSFEELCKKPELACEVTMGPIRDFDFDAAILFSDLLFPLEVLGMGLKYAPGPQFDHLLRSKDDILRALEHRPSASQLSYQGEACTLIRKVLPSEKALIGFVGSPWTLFVYAVEGTHSTDPELAKQFLNDGSFKLFSEFMARFLGDNMALQADAGADCVAIFDTSAGALSPAQWESFLIPALTLQIEQFRKAHPNTPVIYYSKDTGSEHWKLLSNLDVQCMGIDWKHSLPKVLLEYQGVRAIQGNFDPNLLTRPWSSIESDVNHYFESIAALPAEARMGWISGLGHGVLKTTPEENVRAFIKRCREVFGE